MHRVIDLDEGCVRVEVRAGAFANWTLGDIVRAIAAGELGIPGGWA